MRLRTKLGVSMILVSASMSIAGCGNKDELEQLSRMYKECVSEAEAKHAEAMSAMCHANLPYEGAKTCRYPIAVGETIDRSRDNEISACAVMYSPKK